jgi:hypothetical protein
MKSRQQNKHYFVLFIILGFVHFSGYFIFSNFITFDEVKLAKQMVHTCADSSQDDTCYAEAFTKVSRKHSLDESLATLSAFQKLDGTPAGCHFIGHVIAHEAVAKNPANWQAVMQEINPEACSGGLLMGLIEARKHFEPGLKINKLVIQDLCNVKNWNEHKVKTCIHTSGHLALVDFKGNVHAVLILCKTFDIAFQYECMSGAFMENLYRRNLSAHQVSKPSKWTETYLTRQQRFCDTFDSLPSKACWRELSHVIVAITNEKAATIWDICHTSGTKASGDDCYIHAVGVMALTGSRQDTRKKDLCLPFRNEATEFQRCKNMLRTSLDI